jgi:hypothetical protein
VDVKHETNSAKRMALTFAQSEPTRPRFGQTLTPRSAPVCLVLPGADLVREWSGSPILLSAIRGRASEEKPQVAAREARSTFSKIFTPSTAAGSADADAGSPRAIAADVTPSSVDASLCEDDAKSAFASCGRESSRGRLGLREDPRLPRVVKAA